MFQNRPSTFKKTFKLKMEHVWAIVVLVSIFIFVNTHPIRPNDFWFHVSYGRALVTTGQIPLNDEFSFTMAGQPYPSIYNYWLAQLLMYSLFTIGGPEWTILAFSLMVTAAYGILFLINMAQGGNWRAAALGVLFAALLGATNWNVRPQLLAYLLAALSMLAIEKYRSSQKRWPWGLVLMGSVAVWVNSHGTFFVPLALVSFWGIEAGVQAIRVRNISEIFAPLKLSGFLLGGMLLNPQGYKIVSYLYGMLQSNTVQQYVMEWQPPSIHNWVGILFFCMLGTSLLLWIFSHYRPNLAEILSFLFFAILALRYERGISWFGLTQAPLIAAFTRAIFKRTKPAATREIPFLNVTIVALQLLLALGSLPWLRAYWPLAPEKKNIYTRETPIQAVSYMLRNEPPGNVFSDIAFSGYITWASDTNFKVFIDPRFELYPVRLWQEYLQINAATPGWDNLLADHDVQILMLSPQSQLALIDAARKSADWREVYSDESATLFVVNK